MTKDAVTLVMRLVTRVSAAERRALQRAVKRFGDFVGVPAALRDAPRGVAGRGA
jgi:hypothetical protein